MKFDYVRSLSAAPQVCLYDIFRHAVASQSVARLIVAYRGGDAGAKRRLPAFCFHAHFTHGKRLAAQAEPSGLFMLDFDHLTDEEMALLRERVTSADFAAASAQCLRLAHITPSGKGVRLVCRATRAGAYADCRSISDFQHTTARLLGMEGKMDGAVTDLARLSFCPQVSDIFYNTGSRMFTEAPEVTEFAASRPAAVTAAPPAAPAARGGQQEYHGLPLRAIFLKYFELTGGLPAEGERNTRFYSAARDLRYICDFDARSLAENLPDVGLSAEEVFAVCSSACQSSRASRVPQLVEQAVEALTDEAAPAAEDAPAADAAAPTGGKLPCIYREMVELHPAPFRSAALMSLLPIVGTLATRVRARYLDGEVHSPSFFTVLSAEQASGKSFTRSLVRTLLRSIAQEDAAQREIERAYREELRRKKNAKDQPADPHAKIRIIPASVSIAKLLQRLDNAGGEHLFSFAEELDTVIKSNRGGAWSEKNDIYRNAFDNAEYGQDYMSESSYSATLPVYYNLLFLGTPRQVRRFFNNVENGLVSRCCFCSLPDQFGATLPHFGRLSEAAAARVEKWVSILREAKGMIDLDFLHAPLADWLDRQRRRSLEENNRARDIFRRRSAVVGFRAALTAAPLYALGNSRSRQLLQRFALDVAEQCLNNQLEFAGAELNSVIDGTERSRRTRSEALFEQLPPTFTATQLAAEMRKRGMRSPVRQLVYIWLREGMIKKTDEKQAYERITQNGTDAKTHKGDK